MCIRCGWAGEDPLYIMYHDTEWGVPVHDDIRHFEFITLEGAQAGLSWITILRKRENYRRIFENFDFNKIISFDSEKIEQILKSDGIIKNRLKILSVFSNAQAFIKIREEYGTFDKYIWNFTNGETITNDFESISEIPASTELSEKISRDLKKRGFKFVGPTIVYSYMQAVGIVNDHINSCFKKKLPGGTIEKY